VVRIPVVTGTLFVLLTMTAIVTAMFYERRTFCRYLCPIGGLIGLYSMFSPVELRSKDCGICREHKKKECYLGGEKGRACPMFEIMPVMDSNNACNFCGECVKSCSRDNITLRFRTFFKDAWTTRKRSLDEAVLAIVLVGVSIFVTGDMLEPWAGWMETAKGLVPAEALGIEYDYTVEVIAKSVLFFGISLVLIPAMMVLAAYVSNRLAGSENSPGLKSTFVTFGYMFIPVGLSMHLVHNMGHLFKESMGVVPAFQRAVNKYTQFNAGEPDWQMGAMSLIDASFLYWLQMLLFAGFYTFALYAGYRLSLNYYKDENVAFRAYVPMAVLSFILMMVNIYLLNLPMAPRHVH
jgi:ferredoxin